MPEERSSHVGTQVRQRRNEFGLSLHDLAARIELTAGFLGQVASGFNRLDAARPSCHTGSRPARKRDGRERPGCSLH